MRINGRRPTERGRISVAARADVVDGDAFDVPGDAVEVPGDCASVKGVWKSVNGDVEDVSGADVPVEKFELGDVLPVQLSV